MKPAEHFSAAESRQMKRLNPVLRYVFSACLAGLWAWCSPAAGVVIVDDGSEPAPIVLSADAPPMIRTAAGELAACIEKISGARPAIVAGAPPRPPARAVWIGCVPAAKKRFPKIDFAFAHPEEILIAAGEHDLVIAGRDRWDPAHLVVEGIDEKIVGAQREYGTVNAIYTFLQEYLGIRWLWPGELGEDVPRRKTIALKPFVYRYHPQIRARGGVFTFSRLSNKGYGRCHGWSRRQRLQLGSLRLDGGHAFSDWWERFGETRPALFALQPDGTRSGFPRPRNAKLCQSNPAVWKQWLADVEAQLEKDPIRTTFNASPNDSWASGHCVCKNCAAWDHPDGERRRFHWRNRHGEHVALSDRHVTFANRLGALLEERYPDRDYYVTMISYGHSRPPPVAARPAENVIIVSVANFYGRTHLADRGSPRGTTHREQFRAWGAIAPHVAWRPNTGSPAGWQQGLPDLSVGHTIKNFRFVAEHGCIGIYIDSVWEHWATQGPQYYVTAQLAWDPGRAAQEILADYYCRGFGPAAADVRAYFETFERARMAYVEKHGYKSGVLNFPLLYTGELLDRAAGHLRRAAAAAERGPAIHRRRVAFVRAGLAYTAAAVETIRLMKGYWREPDPGTAARVTEHWKTMRRICEEHPFAVNGGPVRSSTPRMRGLHPEYPHPKWKPKKRAKKKPADRDRD